MLKFINPSLVVAKSLQGIIEIVLRAASIVLSVICIAAASAYFGHFANLCSTVDSISRESARDPSIVVGSCKALVYVIQTATSFQSRKFGFDEKSAAGWIIFLSILVIIYQVLAFLQLFLHFKLLHIKIPLSFLKTFWTLFFIIDILAMAVFALFYFCGATAVAVLAKDWKAVIDVYRGDAFRRDYYAEIADHAMKVYSATIAICVFSFIGMLLYIGAVVYFLVAKLLLKKPTHGAEILLLEEADVRSEE